MRIKVLFIQRKCRHPGEYAPEAIACVDEFSFDENPDAWSDQCIALLKPLMNEISADAVIELEVKQGDIVKLLNRETPIPAKVVQPQ